MMPAIWQSWHVMELGSQIRAKDGGGGRGTPDAAERRGSGASAAGIWTRTLLGWMKVPEFQAAYREARRAAYSQAVARLQQGATAAATTLLKVMLDQATPASVRVRAAECIMNHSSKAIEIEDVEARVSELERVAAATNSREQ